MKATTVASNKPNITLTMTWEEAQELAQLCLAVTVRDGKWRVIQDLAADEAIRIDEETYGALADAGIYAPEDE